jgi:transposase
MQAKDLQHRKVRIATLPLINRCFATLGVRHRLEDILCSARYAAAIELLIKSLLIEPAALYRVPAWAQQFDPIERGAAPLTDAGLGRALDRLFQADRATVQPTLTLVAIARFAIDVSQIHSDSTSVKFSGAYTAQSRKGVHLTRGHSKDHRPDLKQLLYNLSMARDGAVPIHFKTHAGHQTDDTLHIENWLTLRRLVGGAGFLYVADSKLCTTANMRRIDQEHGRFVTIVPRTRAETHAFATDCYEATVRWDPLLRQRSTRRRGMSDVFSVASEAYQLAEGFRLYWYRSSEKRKRDASRRKDRLEIARHKLAALNEKKARGRRTERSLLKQAHQIIARYQVALWLTVTVSHRVEETFTQTARGKPSPASTYHRTVKHIPQLMIQQDPEQLARAKAIDGIFPLVTNTSLSAKAVLEAYKYQPHIEKRFSGLKSDFQVAPVFLKNNERIEALMLVVYLADLVAALIQRDLRHAMEKSGIRTLRTLPEERPTSTPTWEQVQRLFAQHCRYEILRDGKLVRTFWDEWSEPQHQVLQLLKIPQPQCGAKKRGDT